MDDIQRMILGIGDIAAKLLGKEPPSHSIIVYDEIEASGDLYDVIFLMLDRGQICRAENLLFKTLETGFTENKYLVGTEFYKALSALTDSELKKSNFSRAEITQGLSDLEKLKQKNNKLPPQK